ncbi:MAG: hypothetical protein H7222_00985 [Methylotenera sp.]|nr:hypothetical protein [Oligoflexia bacterium]
MSEIVKLAVFGLFISSVSFANMGLTHLERLKSRYPYGLIGEDYGLLNEEDLAVNTCSASKLTPFSGDENMAYSYWQCFPLKDAKMECDSLGYDTAVKKETGYLVIDALNEKGLQSYLARDAMDIRDCKKYLQYWRQKTRGERYVCISGSYGGFSGFRNGHKETNWVFDKFRTRKGCESHRSECTLKEIVDTKHCLLPRG